MNQRYGIGNRNHVVSPRHMLAVLSEMLPCVLRYSLLLGVFVRMQTLAFQ